MDCAGERVEVQVQRPVREDLYAIGRIQKCFGVKGELVVESMTPKAERFAQLERVLVGDHGGNVRPKTFGIEYVRSRRNDVVVKLEGLDDRTSAEELIGDYLFVTNEERISLTPHAYFVHDIVGLKVEDEEGVPIGTVVDVLRLPAEDVYVVRQHSKEFWIPSAREIIRNVDLEKRVLKIRVIEGLLEPR